MLSPIVVCISEFAELRLLQLGMTQSTRLNIFSHSEDFGYQDRDERATEYWLEVNQSRTVTLVDSHEVRYSGRTGSIEVKRWQIDAEKLAALIRDHGTKLA